MFNQSETRRLEGVAASEREVWQGWNREGRVESTLESGYSILIRLGERIVERSKMVDSSSGEMTLGEDTKDPTTHWGSERIGCED